ncbi:MAG: hypothetical protein JWL76_1956 [Thermoleophilia bacterium]|nr:hypothetical protein [Thermoleophilia bacterium]
MATFRIYTDIAGHYRWRLVAANGEKIASSGEAFSTRSGAKAAARTVKASAGTAAVEE